MQSGYTHWKKSLQLLEMEWNMYRLLLKFLSLTPCMPVRLMAYDQKYSINRGNKKKRVIYFHHLSIKFQRFREKIVHRFFPNCLYYVPHIE